MGNLIKVLGKDLENCPHFFLDFESKCLTGVRCVFLCACVLLEMDVVSGLEYGQQVQTHPLCRW